jgi:sporulation protein YlmC with PRC-barrel domain
LRFVAHKISRDYEEFTMKSHLTACLLASTLIAAPAFAQSTIPSTGTGDRPAATAPSGATGSGAMSAPGASGTMTTAPSTNTAPSVATSPANPPAGSPPASGSTAMSGAAGSPGGFVTMQEQNQLLASSLIGTRVVSQNDESIGDVNDVLMDSSGRAMAVVVGVGGFLGIGEKNVAVPFEMLEFVKSDAAATTGSTATGTASTTGGAAGSPAATTSSSSADRGIVADPTRIMLKTSKADLQSAPTFRRYEARSNQAPAGSTAPGTAPRQ